MATLEIGGELNFVHGEERNRDIHRHRFHRAHEIARVRRNHALFAGDKRSVSCAFHAGNLVEHFAREKPQRKPDHARAMGEHALDREVRLAGIGGAEDGGQAAVAPMA